MYKERDVESLWEKYTNLLKKLNNKNIDNLINDCDQRILTSSYSLKESEPFCGIGGNVEYALNLAKNANSICKALNYNVSQASIIKCSLLSIVGRIGTQFEDRLIETTSEWHKEKLGQYYTWNENCQKYSVNHMTTYYLQKYNIILTWEEFETLILLNDSSNENNKFYGFYKNRLTMILGLAHEATLKDEFDRVKGVYTIPF